VKTKPVHWCSVNGERTGCSRQVAPKMLTTRDEKAITCKNCVKQLPLMKKLERFRGEQVDLEVGKINKARFQREEKLWKEFDRKPHSMRLCLEL
jgi:hypothetical protein